MRIKLKANRQTGPMGSGSPTHWRIASAVGKDEDLLPRRSAAIIGAAQAQRSYSWCGYAAIIGAATQLLLVLLRSYHWCGLGAAQRFLVLPPHRISRAAYRS